PQAVDDAGIDEAAPDHQPDALSGHRQHAREGRPLQPHPRRLRGAVRRGGPSRRQLQLVDQARGVDPADRAAGRNSRPDRGQRARGDQVQVGGVPVGSVKDIELTHDFRAVVTIHVVSSLTPLHEGTVAQVRVPSLSSVANRYIALTPGPNNNPALAAGTKLPASATQPVTDLDQLFNTFNPKTRKGLSQFIQGMAEQYAGSGRKLAATTEYF